MTKRVPVAVPLAFVLMAFVAAAASAQSPDAFIRDAVKANISEIKLGKLAQSRGSTEAVRSFGRTLVEDHTKAAGDAVMVAKQLNVNAPQQPSAEGETFYEKAQQLRGKAFDLAFATYMVNDHQKDIEAYTEQANDQSSQPVAAYAANNLRVLQKHLAAAQQIQDEAARK
jgi:putative membrane protein